MRPLLLTTKLALIFRSLFAVEQMPDVFLDAGKEAELNTRWGYIFPLEHLFKKKGIESPFEDLRKLP